jgi:hypothetical protein
MLKSWMHDIALSIRARSGFTPTLLIWFGVIAVAVATAFAFLCVAGYVWAAQLIGPVFAGLAMAGVFLLIALVAAAIAAADRRRARERAILERAARAHSATSWLLDPKILGVAFQAGRALGWERIVPLALVGFLAAQWMRERREQKSDDNETT